MIQKLVRPSYVLQPLEGDLREDGAELAARGGDAVRGRAVACREYLAGDDERRRVRPEVLEEVCEAVQEHEDVRPARRRRQSVVREACNRTCMSMRERV